MELLRQLVNQMNGITVKLDDLQSSVSEGRALNQDDVRQLERLEFLSSKCLAGARHMRAIRQRKAGGHKL